MSRTPIYDAVCEDLKVFPRAMKSRNHTQFMRDERQDVWLRDAFSNAYDSPQPMHSPAPAPIDIRRTPRRKR